MVENLHFFQWFWVISTSLILKGVKGYGGSDHGLSEFLLWGSIFLPQCSRRPKKGGPTQLHEESKGSLLSGSSACCPPPWTLLPAPPRVGNPFRIYPPTLRQYLPPCTHTNSPDLKNVNEIFNNDFYLIKTMS